MWILEANKLKSERESAWSVGGMLTFSFAVSRNGERRFGKEKFVKGVKVHYSPQVIVRTGNIKFDKFPVTP